ncbi:hypothetical protein COV15_00425 [Candidatus Woesearchaeota archaeon CG10_big_fil_rev_8_21_14_0_10_34_12]|nr:MAG: hypothetical protein COV15_00425 [Candidatus Woesearchaeota archaeon CG10_big_fil_rev_8_21_14_0_10_34_12]
MVLVKSSVKQIKYFYCFEDKDEARELINKAGLSNEVSVIRPKTVDQNYPKEANGVPKAIGRLEAFFDGTEGKLYFVSENILTNDSRFGYLNNLVKVIFRNIRSKGRQS